MARLDNLSTWLISVAAVCVIGVTMHKEFGGSGGANNVTANGAPPVYVPDWQALRSVGTLVGDSNAKVTMVVFSDFECPFCQRFHEAWMEAKQTMGNDLALVFINYPISSHKFARPGIFAAQCAQAQGHFPAMLDVVFTQQDSMGIKPWSALAADAGVPDTVAFNACFRTGGFSALTKAGIAKADSMEVHATPTVLVNGWRYSGFRSDSLLEIAKSRMTK